LRVIDHRPHLSRAEVVLSALLERFVFAPAKDEIVWRLSIVQVPCVKGREHEPSHMPMRLSFAEGRY
jgi:hypothetical protein